MAQHVVVIDGEMSLTTQIDGEVGIFTRTSEETPPDPYGLWTDIVGLYLGRDLTTGAGNFATDEILDSSGNVIRGNRAVCEVYIPINHHYTYIKSDHRISLMTFYDKDKRFLSQDTTDRYDTHTYGVTLNIPSEAKYIRFCVRNIGDEMRVRIIRIS